ncbi:MAG: hypothetical protein J6T01_00475 [Kiritimatiellae bacterium]|nr:hypothetical protein [Kiritimatiellia bacterium]
MTVARARMRRGLTFAETMIAGALAAVVLTVVLSVFITAQNMLRTAMAESELSLALREMRDKLLFKVSPDVYGRHYAGLLSGRKLNESEVRGANSVEITGRSVGGTLTSAADASARLLVWTVGTKKMLVNERTPEKDKHLRWLWPGALALAECTGMSDLLGYDSWNSSGSNIYRLYFDIAVAADVNRRDGSPIVRRERVMVPLLGKLQPFKDAGGRY